MSKAEKIDLIHRTVSLLPGIWLIFLWSYAVRVAVSIGHWPYYGHPDPATLDMRVHDYATMFSFVLGIAAVFTWAVLTVFFWKYLTKRTVVVHASMVFLCIAISVIQIKIDPGGVIDWFMD